MKKDDISPLLERYLSARETGKEPYFDADEIDQLLSSLNESEEKEYFKEILALGLKLHPDNIDLQVKQCQLYVDNDEYERALTLIDSIAATDNKDLDLLRLECYCMIDRYDMVIKYTEELIASNCSHLEAVFEYICSFLNEVEMIDEARDFIKRGLALFPNNVALKDELCYIMEMGGSIDRAIVLCNQLIDKSPYSYEYWFTLGRLYSVKGEYDKAIEAFDFALTCNDSNPELKILKAYCLYMNESYEKALEVYDEIKEPPHIVERTLQLRAECYIKLENYPEAYKILKNILNQNQTIEDASIYINFIRCCAEMERDQEAFEILLKAVTLFPDDIRLLSLMAMTYVENGEDQLALEVTNQLFKLLDEDDEYPPEDFETLYNAAQYLYMKGDFDTALRYFKRVYAGNPDLPYLHLHMAMAYMAKGDMKHFGEHFQQTSSKEMIEFMENSGMNMKEVEQQMMGKRVPPEDLAKEFLNNKDNNN